MKFSYSFFIVLLLLSSCSTSSNFSKMSQPVYAETAAGTQDLEETALDLKNKEQRKILFSAGLTLVVKDRDSTNIQIEKIAQKHNGYVNKTGTYQTVIRVKSEFLDSALNEISTLGKIRNKDKQGQDVTESYMDFKIRLDNAEKSRNRYLELLEKAETVAEILLVEKELERLNGKIELLKGKMNRIEHLDEFSTITINLREKKKPGILGYVGLGIYHTVKWLFVRN